ncbi:YafY family protein [uncultured Nocardioides sp.]|uniref:helix-turn-helix transcriptional regulator n=1 Tax=uncultured Nocardioides sp. TaxID=198441 RepID=UPI00262ED72B|nr:WYL domain-containing protein [uncultured Nocardioides sp.]
MRADRLLSIMLLLRTHRTLTAGDLAGRLEVSERTVLRDVEALSAAGVPVYTERGRHGGIAMLEGFRAEVGGLDDVEAQVLLAHLGLDTFGDLGLDRELGSALDKLTASAPPRLAEPVRRLREVVHVDRRRWFADPDDVGHLPALRSACVAGRRVRVRYASPRDDRPRTRTLDPLGLVENGSRWYLVAYHRGDPRTYRLARVRSLEVLGEAAVVPPGARLTVVWDELRSGFEARPGPPVEAVLRLRPASPTEEEELRGALQTMAVAGGDLRVADRGDGWVDVAGRFRLARSLVGLSLASAGAVEILEPASLRARAREAAVASLGLLDPSEAITVSQRQ